MRKFFRPTNLKAAPKAFSFFQNLNRGFSSEINIEHYRVRLIPQLEKDAKIILPISMTRYVGDKKKRQQYDKEINALLRFTAESLKQERVGAVEVLSTTGLQEINWGKERADEIENYFMGTHQSLLARQTRVHTWEGFVDLLGRKNFEDNYQLIKAASTEGTIWHNQMLRTYRSVKVVSDIEKSLEYQRREYAVILSARERYTHMAYMGRTSLAWSYLYRAYKNVPIFARVSIEKISANSEADFTEPDNSIETLWDNTISAINEVAKILNDVNVPASKKDKFIDNITSLLQTHAPSTYKQGDESEASKKLR